MSPRPTIADRSGFTLLETLIAIAILSIATVSVSFAFPGLRERSELRLATARLDDLLARAKDEALRSHQATVVRVDMAERRIGVPALDLWRKLPSEVDVSILGAASGFRTDEPMIAFFADGSSTGGVIELRLGAHKTVRRVAWLTGRIERGS
jgi:general secretion pathway protein H